jgi:membrane fusion protein, peptide pheromone/bacteriocin exporter
MAAPEDAVYCRSDDRHTAVILANLSGRGLRRTGKANTEREMSIQPRIHPLHPDLLETHLSPFCRTTSAIYAGLLALILGGIAVLPLVEVNVAVVGWGILRPTIEKHEVRIPASGAVDQVLVQRGGRVAAGDTILTLRASGLEERIAVVAERVEEQRAHIHDLVLLTRGDTLDRSDSGPRTARYRREYVQLQYELADLGSHEALVEQELERARAMAERGLVSVMEVEDREFRHRQARSAYEMAAHRPMARWQAELGDLMAELRQLEASLEDLIEERAGYVLIAPVTGTIEELLPVSSGSYLRAGEPAAIISPDAPLEAELFVAPKDVGLLSVGMPVRLHVDAFNFSDWGHVPARITAIGADFVVLDQEPAFRVRAGLERTELTLPSGVRGELRKGMTVTGRFLIAERTLLQLLRDDIGDWLDPRRTRSDRGLSVAGRAGAP